MADAVRELREEKDREISQLQAEIRALKELVSSLSKQFQSIQTSVGVSPN